MIRDDVLLRPRSVSSFDVICAGEARWDLAEQAAITSRDAVRFQPGGAAVHVAFALARRGLRVGLAASLGDDTAGRALARRVAAAGIDISGVSLSPPRPGLLLVEGTGDTRRIVAHRPQEPGIMLPEGWAAQVLLLTGCSPIVEHAAAFCREARAARRAGTVVVVDVNARPRVWMGHDPRAIRAVMGAADVAHVRPEDLAVLRLDPPALRAMMRPDTALVVTGAGRVHVLSPFGDIAREAPAARAGTSGDTWTAALCAELLRVGAAGIGREETWDRLLRGAALAGHAPGSLLRA